MSVKNDQHERVDCLLCETVMDRDTGGKLLRCPAEVRVCHLCCEAHHRHGGAL